MNFLVAPLTIASIAGGFAALISIVDKHVNDYGDVTININSDKKNLDVRGGDSLLTTLSSEGIFIPSACGGRGSCGACKCKIVTDVGPHLPTEVPYLTKEEMGDNIRLACQIKVKKDLELQIPDELFNVKQFIGRVEKIVDLTHDIKEVLIDIGEETIDFDAGAYVQLVVPPYGKIKDINQRAYSMSSRPSDKSHIEMLIRLVPGGIATTWVHTLLKEGDKVDVIGPFGDFLAHSHTYQHMREQSRAEIIDRRMRSAWEMDGAIDSYTRAIHKVRTILENHVPEPLAPEVLAGIRRIVEETEKKMGVSPAKSL